MQGALNESVGVETGKRLPRAFDDFASAASAQRGVVGIGNGYAKLFTGLFPALAVDGLGVEQQSILVEYGAGELHDCAFRSTIHVSGETTMPWQAAMAMP